MITVITPPENARAERNGTTTANNPAEETEGRLSNHPLWPEFLEQLAENRRVDIERALAEFGESDDIPAGH